MNNTKVIAEVGWGHLGDMDLAKEMITQAALAGADYVKFQTWSVSNLKSGPWDADGRREIYNKAELSYDNHILLKQHCEENNVKFLTSCFNSKDLEKISNLTKEIKIPSSEIANIEILEKCCLLFDNIFLSTGASTEDEILNAVKILNKKNLTLLHCVSTYPCEYNKANLPKINFLKKIHNSVGYSGHCIGIYDALESLNYDVSIIEKHFTIDNNLPGRDNKFAILPHELKILCEYIKLKKALNNYLGNSFQDKELEIREVYRGRWCN